MLQGGARALSGMSRLIRGPCAMITAEKLLVRGTEGQCFEHQVKEMRNRIGGSCIEHHSSMHAVAFL